MKKILIGAVLLIALGIWSCDKKDTLPTRYTSIPAGNTNIKFLFLSPDAPQVNFFANNVKVSAVSPTSTGKEQGVVYPSILPASIGYTTIPSGSIKIEGKVPDSSTVMPGAVISTSTENLAANKFYTYAIVDSMSRISTVLVEDDPSVPDMSKAYFRVANFVSSSPAVKIEIIKTSSGTAYSKTFASINFKTVTPFEPIEAGTGQTYKVYLKNATTDAKLDSISSFAPTNTKKYTIYARGVMGLTGTNTKRPIITSYTNF